MTSFPTSVVQEKDMSVSMADPAPRSRAANAVIVVAGIALLALVGASLYPVSGGQPGASSRVWRNATPPRGDAGAFSFAVFGDIQDGTTVFVDALRDARRHGCLFGVVVGDLVSLPREASYRHLTRAVIRSGPLMPLLAVPGNHDVTDGGREYERLIGAREFAFVLGDCLFVGLDNGAGRPMTDASLELLRRSLRETEGDVRHRFLFIHKPLDAEEPAAPGVARDRESTAEVFDLVRRYRVDYVFAGHRHAYTRRRLSDGTTVCLANGMGGDARAGRLLPREAAWTLVTVSPAAVEDRQVVIGPKFSVSGLFRFQIDTAVRPLLWSHPWIGVVLGLGGLFLVILGFRRLLA